MSDHTPDAVRRSVDLLELAARLKRLPRTGWVMCHVPDAETIGAHVSGVVLASMLIADMAEADGEGPLDREKMLSMAAVHDLPEAVLGDVPTPAMKHLPQGAKTTAEAGILGDLVAGTPVARRWRDLWTEFAAKATPEARLVNDADKLDMFLQALLYERAGHADVERFWEQVDRYDWAYAATRTLLDELKARRP